MSSICIIFDDRESLPDPLKNRVGANRFGDLHIRNQTLLNSFKSVLSEIPKAIFKRIRHNSDLDTLVERQLSVNSAISTLIVIAARGALTQPDQLTKLIDRMRHNEHATRDNREAPLFHSFPVGNLEWMTALRDGPLHLSNLAQKLPAKSLKSAAPLIDISGVRAFMDFVSGSTQAREFNEVVFDDFLYSKASSDIKKMRHEYEFYRHLSPEMRIWMVEPFAFHSDEKRAGYTMRRYWFSDAAFQWVNLGFTETDFQNFLVIITHIFRNRETLKCSATEGLVAADKLFLDKVETRLHQFQTSERGRNVYNYIAAAPNGSSLLSTYETYRNLYQKHRHRFKTNNLALGHGDPCFSNILYEKNTRTLLLIDPRGAESREALFTHPLYDYCKLSHSALGLYDLINNGKVGVTLDHDANFILTPTDDTYNLYAPIFESEIKSDVDLVALRLGEASLFLSMVPLHLDHPQKVIAFIITANNILKNINFKKGS